MNKEGYLLIEASITCLIISLSLVALVPMFILSLRANTKTEQVKVATQLSVELLEEIRLRKWDQKTPSPPQSIALGSAIGVDSGETASDKRTFNDIDDFNGWSESPPMDPLMQPLSNFSGYSRNVTVSYVDAGMNPNAGPTDYKEVTVCTQRSGMSPACLSTLFTNR